MMIENKPVICVKVDVTNPGQFLACCGLLELAGRIWHKEMRCWFAEGVFFVSDESESLATDSLGGLLDATSRLPLKQLDLEDPGASALHLEAERGMRLDWWQDSASGGQSFKTWAGSQNVARIACAMQSAIFGSGNQDYLDHSTVVYDRATPKNKVEPFYFDSRRGARPFSRDIGFAPDALQMTTPAYPAVEFLCLVGLQRCRPRETDQARVFDYFTWQTPLAASVLPAAVCGLLPAVGARGYRFENAFRTDQRKHKAFSPALPTSRRYT